ncbi:tyrosine-protein phosphatase [Nocardioides sp. HM23]|uniref:tyrosine-protein phosphatase n=1 Tax=Nocardioides bizhenqiangii TaxID=3095076 RepID=UPI002ACA7577|nr:tyrosine-protein phosphatase [Nocardioides sp. HM23]MDZ5619232.1 tyrosine-protein phosphatase [Nocardioides sp. HM23]
MTSSSDEILRLASADNFRDVAGAGYATHDGARVRRGVFFRSNELRLNESDHDTLAGLGLRAVLDLRSKPEIERHPDAAVPGATWHNFDVSGIPMEQVAALRDRRSAVELMDRVYRSFVDSEAARVEFGGLLRQLATGGPQLFHCTAGKDRTGWVAALLLHIAGVDDPTIESDYLLTNALTGSSRARVEAEIVTVLGGDHVSVFEPTLVADIEYLRSGYDAVQARYGDRAAYLREGLGLDDDVVTALRDLLREDEPA